MTEYETDEGREVQFAEVTIEVAFPVDSESDEDFRRGYICRKLRESDMAEGVELRPHLLASNVSLTRTETMRQARRRAEGEAEAAAEAKLDRARERHFDRRGHF